MLIVADTSALLALAACDSLPLLDRLFEQVRVPAAVYHECAVPGKPHSQRLEAYLVGRIVTVDLSEFVIAVPGLGRGELEAMALYKHLHADRLLIDDGRGRRVATLNGVEVIGSIGILLLARSQGLVPAVRPLLQQVEAAGIHFSAALIDKALQLSGEA